MVARCIGTGFGLPSKTWLVVPLLLAAATATGRGDDDLKDPKRAAEAEAKAADENAAAEKAAAVAKEAAAKAAAVKEAAAKAAAVKEAAAKEAAAKPGAAETKPADKPADPKKEPNPLGDLIKRAFGGADKPAAPARKPPVVTTPDTKPAATPDETPEKGPTKDHIDARAPQDPAQSRRLRQAKRALDEKSWRTAIEALQSILDQKQDTLIRLEDGRWASVRAEAQRMIGALPPEARDSYQLQFGAVAEQLLKETSGPAGQDHLLEAASRYFYTQAGQRAADQLVGLVCDEGQYGLAARWIRQLLAVDAECTHSPRWKLKAAFALHQAGDPSTADKLLSELRRGDTPVQVSVGDQQLAAADWLKSASGDLPSLRSLDDWPVLHGNATRTGLVSKGDPLLLARWSLPLTANRSIQDQIRTMTEDLSDLKRATIPAMAPLMVDGKVIFRTLRGFAVADVQTGKLLWETREGISAEQLLSGMANSASPNYSSFRFGRQVFVQDYMSTGGGENHALASLLFRDGNYGLASSDGRRVFVVEDMAILSRQEMYYGGWWGGGFQQADPFSRDWASNKLTAYDLHSGRPLWDTGGEEMLESFDLPLSGSFFFGPPLPDAGELFVVGEKSNEIKLHCLDGLTGRPQWSQLLALSETKIEQDIARRRWTAQVASRDGVVVCPTTVGWLVAVDRRQRSILWAHRYSKPSPQQQQNFAGNGTQFSPMGELNTQWGPSAPMISGRFVVYAPTEDPVVVCLDLHTGEKIWERKKGENEGSSTQYFGRPQMRNLNVNSDESLYVAGIFGDRVVLVGRQAISAVDLATGKNAWKHAYEEANGRPAGVGICDGTRYYLPLSSGQLWTISVSDGKVVEKSYLPQDQPALGNLAMYRGLLLSLSPEGMTSFEQRTAIEQEIARRRAANPDDAWALLRESDIALLKRDYGAALERLRKVQPEGLPEADRPRYRRSRIESLAALIRADFEKAPEAEIRELAEFVQSEDEKLLERRLTAERLHARREIDAAFDTYLSLVPADGAPGLRAQRVAAGTSPVRVRLDRWLAGRLQDLWTATEGDQRTRLDSRIAAIADESLQGSAAARDRFAVLFGFHSSAVPVRRKLIDDLIANAEFARAEAELLALKRSADPAVAAPAAERLARLLAAQGISRDADVVYSELERSWPDAQIDGRPVKELVAAWRAMGAARPLPPGTLSWANADVKVQRSPTNYYQQTDFGFTDAVSQLPFFQELRFQVSMNSQRLTVSRAEDEATYWSVPLRSHPRAQSQTSVAEAAGHLLFVIHRDVLHALSPVDRRVLWTTQVDTRGAGSGYYRQPGRPAFQALRPSLQGFFNERANQNGMLAVANSEYVCLYGRRQIAVHDAATGALRWTRDEIPPGTVVTGTSELVLILKPEGAVALRAADGREVETKLPADLQTALVGVTGDSLILVGETGTKRIFGLGGRTSVIRSVEPLSGRELWNHEFPPNAAFGRMNDDELAILRPDGRLDVVNLGSGTLRTAAQVNADEMKSRSETYVFQDSFRTYVLINNGQRNQQMYFGEELPTVHANGTLAVFDRATAKPAWSQKVSGGQMVTMQIGTSPVLTFINRSLERKGNMAFWLSKLKVMSKEDGRTLAETKSANGNGYQSFDVNMADRFVELRSYNERIRLLAVNREKPAEAELP